MKNWIRSDRNLRGLLAAAFGAAFVVAGCIGTAQAQDADEQPESFDAKIMKDLMRGIGLRDGTEKGIDYHERSPLVIPPSRDLPPPAATSAAIVNDPAWPNDKDVPNSPRNKKKKKVVISNANSIEESDRPLRPDELDAGRGNSRNPNGPERRSEVLTASELGYKGNLFSLDNILNNAPETGKFAGEPPRASLTDPPSGYRTPASNQPYGANIRDQIKPSGTYDEMKERALEGGR